MLVAMIGCWKPMDGGGFLSKRIASRNEPKIMWNEDVVSEQAVIKFKLPQHWSFEPIQRAFPHLFQGLRLKKTASQRNHCRLLLSNPCTSVSATTGRRAPEKSRSPRGEEGGRGGRRGKRLGHSSNCCTDCIPDQRRLLLKRPRQKEENQKLVPMMIQWRVTTRNKVC